MKFKTILPWCRHIRRGIDGNGLYYMRPMQATGVRQNWFFVPKNWICCPVCQARRPKLK